MFSILPLEIRMSLLVLLCGDSTSVIRADFNRIFMISRILIWPSQPVRKETPIKQKYAKMN